MKKDKIYITELIDNPVVTYPMTYIVSIKLVANEFLKDALVAIHSFDFDHYKHPASWHEIYNSLNSGGFAIYKERYAVSEFGGKLMYLEGTGWSSMRVTSDIFDMRFWLVGA